MGSISGVNGSSNVWANVQAQRTAMQTKMFAKIDTDSSGGVDQTELATILADVSQKTGTKLDAAKQFSTMDSNADGSLSSDELASGMKDVLPPPPSTMQFAQGRQGMGGGEDQFAKVDTNSDGSLDEAEMTAFTDKMKADTGRDSPTTFAKLDTDSDGKLTQAEFEAGKPKGPKGDKGGAQGVQGAGGPPPPSGPGGAKGASETSATDSTTYDPLDTNQDGTVSELERLAGALSDFVNAAESNTTSDSSQDSLVQLAKQVYEQIASGVISQRSGTLDATA